MADFKIIIRVSTQKAELFRDGERLKIYKISTALNGLGCEVGSNKTPTGLHRVAKKIGADCGVGTVFRSRVSTGEVWSPDPLNPLCNSNEDLVLSRILWLEGMEAHNANTLDRYVYLHGTNQEHLLGNAVSHGCIRLSNQDVIELFDLVPEGTLVEIVA
jgi:lipoprotein-anchoring transpeptidase ErfK/SrfK